MVTLADVFEQLSAGELAQLSLGGWEGKTVPEKDRSRVISHINMGLIALYTRFWISSKEVIIQIYDHIQTYELDRKFAITNKLSVEPYRYIIDSVYQPFENDVLKIEQVFNEGGELMFLNDMTQPWSVFTPSYKTLQIPFPEKHNSMVVHYRAGHKKIVLAEHQDPAEVEIHLPLQLLEPLLFYVAHRAFASLNSDQNQEGNNYFKKYENACKAVELKGLLMETSYGNHRLDQNGWI